ncbi:MAG: hypothetical protein EXR62_10635, partial [Chloroflexi bacterium]|nr:hypothetical protein [Chloroflexota bacterium]
MSDPKFFRILSIDGGGIRGLIPAQILTVLEDKLKRASHDPTTRIADWFDLIAGTSTGGILTCIYLCPQPDDPHRPRYAASEAVELYKQNGAQIFDVSVWHKLRSAGGTLDENYSATGLETLLKDKLHDLKLSDLIKPCLITAYDIENRAAYFFTQHDARKYPRRNFLLRDVARATSAAPTFSLVSANRLPASRLPRRSGGQHQGPRHRGEVRKTSSYVSKRPAKGLTAAPP